MSEKADKSEKIIFRTNKKNVEYIDRLINQCREAGLDMGKSRSQIINMILEYHITKAKKPLSNELFDLLIHSCPNADMVSAYTIRGVCKMVLDEDVDQSHFDYIVNQKLEA